MATPASKYVNVLGKYLYRNLESSLKFRISSNMYDVFFDMLYQIKPENRTSTDEEENDVHRMVLDLNITTYQNKIRVNLIEITPQNRTIGYDLYPVEQLESLPDAMDLIYYRVVKRISRTYKEYDFLI